MTAAWMDFFICTTSLKVTAVPRSLVSHLIMVNQQQPVNKRQQSEGQRDVWFRKAKVQVFDLTRLLSNGYCINFRWQSSWVVHLTGCCSAVNSQDGRWKNLWPLSCQWLSGNNEGKKKKKLDKRGEDDYQVCTWFLKLLDLAAQSNHNAKPGLSERLFVRESSLQYFWWSAITASDSKR